MDFHTWDGIFQGTRSYILGLYREAILLAPDIDFFFFLDNTESLRTAYPEFSAPNAKLVSMPYRSGLRRLTAQLPLLQLRHRLDILHLQYRLPFLPIGRCAVTIHDILYENHPEFFLASYVWEAKRTFRYAARRAAAVFTVSNFSKEEIHARYAVPSHRIHVTYNGVDSNRFHPRCASDPRLERLGLNSQGYFLSVGRLEPRKNHEKLVEAYSQLPADFPPLVLVGQPDFGYDPIFKRIRDLGLQSRVRVLNDIEDDLLPVIMRHARVFVFPSLAEGFGLPIVEAMASGVPVITTDRAALPEVASEAALYVTPENPKEIANAIHRVFLDEKLSETMRTKGLLRSAMFNWRSSAQTLIGVLRRSIAAP